MGHAARRIVVIDDSETMLEVMDELLADAGFEVRTVSSLRRFLNVVLDWRPHVIVTDLYMPEMSGAELCAWLRQQVQTARTPVIICSSASDHELARIARAVGADGFVSKDAGPQALPAKLTALCDEIVF
jgi:CheY-like chemotaxis protein